MKHNITELDKLSLLQNDIKYRYRLYVVDNSRNILDMLEGVRSVGEYNIDSQSDVRRTSSFTLQLDEFYRSRSLEEKIYSWIGYNFQLQIGVFNIGQNDFLWYECGYYSITQTNTSYSSTTNELTVSLSDWVIKMNGQRNGVIGGAPTIKIPVEDVEGNPTVIKQALVAFIKLSTEINSYIVDEIGEYYGFPEYNTNWEQYRKDRPFWNILPYDLEFEGSATIFDIVKELCTLYPNYQYYFDIYGNLCVSMIPSCSNHPIYLDGSYFDKILTSDDSEMVSYNIEEIKNVTEVYGKSYEIDRMSNTCTTSSNIYTITLPDYTSYNSLEYIAFIPNTNNIENMKIRINELDVLPIYLENTTTYLDANTMRKDEVYVLRLKRNADGFVAYYLGQYQPHAICVLTDNDNDPVYTKEYFSTKYNCDLKNIVLRVEDSPFTVQKIGEVLDYKSGGDFDNIESDTVAVENAVYYNRKSTSFNDVVTITTKMIPFLDVYEKVTYRKRQELTEHEYVVKSINHNMDEMISTITMYRFYPLYYA